ncbi:MAG: hypothetical protein PWQ84_884 [Thermotogaceae bacterium]|nr:hypothetical protein [Thermotogaceae bacterium]
MSQNPRVDMMDRIMFGKKVNKEIERLSSEIKNMYLVGGIIRDSYLFGKQKTNDIDLTTDLSIEALKERIKSNFYQPNDAFTICINAGDSVIEMTPFKGKTLLEDLNSRDLTINALAIPIVNGKLDYDNVYDAFGGLQDLQFKVLRTTQESNFTDDPLRILRLFRFQSKLGFHIENLTWRYAVKNLHLIEKVAKERIKKEFDGILMGQYVEMALRNMLNAGVLEQLFEEVKPMSDFLHCDRHHFSESIIEHTIRVVQGTPLERRLRLAAFFHDFAKPVVYDAKKGNHYIGHEKKSAEIAEKILFENRYKKQVIQDVKTLIQFHDVPLEAKSKFNEIFFYHGEALFQSLIQLMIADKKATFANSSPFEESLLAKAEKTIGYKDIFKAMAKTIRGQFLLDIGMQPNPLFSRIIHRLQNKFLKNPETFNDKTLLSTAEKLLHFKDNYGQFYYKKERYQRFKEIYKDGVVYGNLVGNYEFEFQSELFKYHYLSNEAFKELDRGNSYIFYHLPK